MEETGDTEADSLRVPRFLHSEQSSDVAGVVEARAFAYTQPRFPNHGFAGYAGGEMTDAYERETATIQKLLLRLAAAAAAGTPLELLPGETLDTVNATIVAALNRVSRSSRLEFIVEAARPLAERLSGSAEEEGDAIHRFQVMQLVAALNVLNAYDARDPDYTVQE